MSVSVPPQHLSGKFRYLLRNADQELRWHDNGIMRKQDAAAFGAAINPDAAASSIFQTIVRGKVFGDAEGVHQAQLVFHDFPPQKVRGQQSTISRLATLNQHPDDTIATLVAELPRPETFVHRFGTNCAWGDA